MSLFATWPGTLAGFWDSSIELVLIAKWTIVLALAWLAHGMLARWNPRWRVALWRTVVIGLPVVAILSGVPPLVTYQLVPRDQPLIPVEPAVLTEPAVAVRGAAKIDPVGAQTDNPRVRRAAGANPSHPGSDFPAGVARGAAGTAGKSPGVPVMAGRTSPAQGFPWEAGIVSGLWTIWLAGVLVLTARLVVGSVALARLVRRSSEASDGIVRECREIAQRLGWGAPVRVRSTREVATPSLAGLRRPVLLLPAWGCDDARPEDLRAILAHELAHARNRDLVWNLLAHVASIVLWFHPLAWRIRAAHAAACDAVCDAVAADLVGDVASYGRTLARLAVRAAWPAPAHGLAMARTSEVRRRLNALNRQVFRTPLSWRCLMSALFIGSVLLVLIGGFTFTRAEQEAASGPRSQAARSKTTTKAPDVAQPAPPAAAGRLTLRAVAAETNEPIVGVSIEYWGRFGEKRQQATVMTGEDGTAAIEWPAGATVHRLGFTARAPKLVPIHVLWEDERQPIKVPAEKELRLHPGTTIGGIVQDEAGHPVAGVTVDVHAPPTEYEGTNYVFTLGSLTTDVQGRWRLDIAPKDLTGVWGRTNHPHYRQSDVVASRKLDSVTIVKKGLTVTGRVVDAAGRPLRGASVIIGHDTWGGNPPAASTNEQGQFTLENCLSGPTIITVQAEGFAPRIQDVRVDARTAPVEFRMTEPGSVLRVRVVDVQGKPVAGVTFGPDTWRGHRSIHFRGMTGPDGRVEWRSAPKDVVSYYAGKADYMRIRKMTLTASEREQTLTLYPKLVISGRVTDAKTGHAVPRFRVVRGTELAWRDHQVHWLENEGVDVTGGRYTTQFDEPSEALFVSVEAPGYKPAVSRAFRPNEGAQTFDAALEPTAGLSGVVRLPDGRPAEGADVGLSTRWNTVRMRSGRFDRIGNFPKTSAGPDGRFAFPPQAGPFLLIALSDAGYAEASSEQFAKSGTLVLQPWGRIEGGVRIGARFGANQQVMFRPIRPERSIGISDFQYGCWARTDDRGRFQIDHVVPGPGTVVQVVRDNPNPRGAFAMLPCWPERIEVQPGQTVQVTIGGKGRPVIGRFILDGTPEAPVDWTGNLPVLLGVPPEKPDPKRFGLLHFGPRLFASFIDKDGRFRIEDVPAGTYELELAVNGPSDPRFAGPGREIGRVKMSMSVPEIPGGRSNEPLDLGTITAKLFDMIKIGDLAPDFDVERIGTAEKGRRLKLSDYRGKLVLLNFWDTTAGKNDMIILKEVQETFGRDPRFVLISLACGQDAAQAEQAIKQNGLGWTLGFAGDFLSGVASRYKLRASQDSSIIGPDQKLRRVPVTFLIGPDGRILGHDLTGGDLDAVGKALENPKLFPAAAPSTRPLGSQ